MKLGHSNALKILIKASRIQRLTFYSAYSVMKVLKRKGAGIGEFRYLNI
jgi:hypothetical protein